MPRRQNTEADLQDAQDLFEWVAALSLTNPEVAELAGGVSAQRVADWRTAVKAGKLNAIPYARRVTLRQGLDRYQTERGNGRGPTDDLILDLDRLYDVAKRRVDPRVVYRKLIEAFTEFSTKGAQDGAGTAETTEARPDGRTGDPTS